MTDSPVAGMNYETWLEYAYDGPRPKRPQTPTLKETENDRSEQENTN
jgi:hypothetical protein